MDRSQTHLVNIVHGTRQFHSITSSDNSTLQIWTRLKAYFCSSCSIDEWDDCEYIDTIDTWDQVTLGTNFNGVNEIDHLEDDHIWKMIRHIFLQTMISYQISYKQVHE